jgi:PAS domain S-box-containing protein
LGTKRATWLSAAALVGAICFAGSAIEVARSLGPTGLLQSQDEAAKLGALDSALDESGWALAKVLSAVTAESAGMEGGRWSIWYAWARLTDDMERNCTGTFESPAVTIRLDRLCTSFAVVRERVDIELELLKLPSRPLEPWVARELAAWGPNINETTEVVAEQAVAVLKRTADRYRTALIVLVLSTVGFAATAITLLVLIARGSISHFLQWQAAASAAQRAMEARALLHETIEALPAGVILYDSEDRLQLFNSEAASITPVLQQPDVIGMTHPALASASGKARDAAGLGLSDVRAADLIARFKSKENHEFRHLPDGRWFESYEKSTPSGRTVCLRVDVTALKTRELELERTRAEYQALVDSLSDVVFAIDADGVFTFISAAARELFGKLPSQIVGSSFRDYVDPDDVAQLVAAERQLAQTPSGTVQELRLRLRSIAEPSRHVEIKFRKTAAGSIQNGVISGVMRDVEERTQLALFYEHEATRLRSIVESSGALIVMVDRDLRVVMVNSEFTAVSGIRKIDALGRLLKEVVNCPIDPAVLARWLDGPLEQGRVERQKFENILTDAQGRKRIIRVTATPVTDSQGMVRKIVFLGVDDTSRRETELQLFDAERMKGLGEIAATVAHELNQPLQVITFAAEGMIEEIDEAIAGNSVGNRPAREGLNRILEQVERASRLIEELRDHARSTSSEEPSAFALGAAVRGAVALTEHQITLSGGTITLAIPDGLPLVFGHLNRLEQVLINLINNARDSFGEMEPLATKRVITISAKRIGDGWNYVRLVVEDTGHGIAEHVLEHLFEPFLTTKPRGKGTGLGLPLCKRIVEEMGGTISGCNRPEDGARFEITLPAASALGGPPSPPLSLSAQVPSG